eukprot:NODE_2147_length_2282_cov_14.107193.p2 GENE.NODE_2147_length_2282_cov_14.107193~~NODE_2147_length_2282_cov_14.107193.p2  ORF type:complete len:294 (-),score=90.89 NODE_2147_length_2282_cov_14.107193:394-1275(-)
MEALLEDATGQVMQAFSRLDWYEKWGRHYVLSIAFAHKLQFCNNFKDPGVLVYGGDLFQKIQDQADDAFNKLPPPKPRSGSVEQGRCVTSMAAFNTSSCVCFDGSSLALLACGSTKPVRELRRGNLLLAAPGLAGCAVVEVMCVVRTPCTLGVAALVELSQGCRVTPYHPVHVGGTWRFPIDVAAPKEMACDAVYSLVLDGAPAVILDGTPCIALGHGLTEGAAAHSYYGTERVLEDLAAMPGFAAGFVELAPGAAVRDEKTNLVTSLRNPQSADYTLVLPSQFAERPAHRLK